MECEKIRRLLSDYLDNELGPEKRKIVEGHAARCQACSGELARLKDLTSAMGEMGEVSPPSDFAEAVQARIETRTSMERFLRRLFYPPYIKLPIEGAAVCATVLLAFYFAAEMGLIKRPAYMAKKGEEGVVAERVEKVPGLIGKKMEEGMLEEQRDFVLAKKSKTAVEAVAAGGARLRAPKKTEVPMAEALLEAEKEELLPERKPALTERLEEQAIVFSCPDINKAVKDISMLVAILEGSFEYEKPGAVAQEKDRVVAYDAAVSAAHKEEQLAPSTKSLSLKVPADRLPVFLSELNQMGTITSMPAEISPRVLMNVMSLMNERERAILREKFIAIRLEIKAAK